MLTKDRMRFLLLFLVLMPAASCQDFRAISFRGDTLTSNVREGSQVSIETLNSENCGGEIQPGLAPVLIGAIVGVGLNIAENQLDAYLADKKKQFSASYSATLSSEPGRGAYLKSASYKSFNCIRLRRTVLQDKKRVLALEIYIALDSDNDAGVQRLSPRSITLSRAAALTDEATRKLDISVEVKIDAISTIEKGAQKTSVVDQVLSFPGLMTPGGTSGKPNEAVTVYDCHASASPTEDCQRLAGSGWFIAVPKSQQDVVACDKKSDCPGVSPYNLSILVTETGSGADAFGSLGTDIDGNKASINSALSSYLQILLGTPTPTK